MQIDRTGAEPHLVFDRGVRVPALPLLTALATGFVEQIHGPVRDEDDDDESGDLEFHLLEDFPKDMLSAQAFCQQLERLGAKLAYDDVEVMEVMKREGLITKVDVVVEGGVSYALYEIRCDAFATIADVMAESMTSPALGSAVATRA